MTNFERFFKSHGLVATRTLFNGISNNGLGGRPNILCGNQMIYLLVLAISCFESNTVVANVLLTLSISWCFSSDTLEVKIIIFILHHTPLKYGKGIIPWTLNNIDLPMEKFELQSGMGILALVKIGIDGSRHVSSSGRHTENAKSTTKIFSSLSLSMMKVACTAEPMLNVSWLPVNGKWLSINRRVSAI